LFSRTVTMYPRPNLFLMCCGVPKQQNLPATMIPRRLHTLSHSDTECEVSTKEVPCFARFLTLVQTWFLAAGSRPAVGSSRSTSFGFPAKAIAAFNRRFPPPDS